MEEVHVRVICRFRPENDQEKTTERTNNGLYLIKRQQEEEGEAIQVNVKYKLSIKAINQLMLDIGIQRK